MLMHKSNGVTRVFRLDSEEHTWTSEPNEEVVDEMAVRQILCRS